MFFLDEYRTIVVSMRFLRNMTATLVFSLLTTFLFSLGFAWSIYHVFSGPHDLEVSLVRSGVYQSFVGDVLKAQSNTDSSSNDAIPINEPGVQSLVQSAFSPTLLQKETEQVINATYAWTTNQTPSLRFTIDLRGAKQQLATGIGQYVTNRLTALPVCSADTMQTMTTVDPFNVTCIPPGFDVAVASATAESNVLNSDFLKNPVITADTKMGNGQTLDQKFQHAPETYQHIRQGLIWSFILVIALGTATIFLADNRRAGLRRLAAALITMGLFSIVLDWFSVFAVHKLADRISTSTSTNKALEQHAVSVIESLVNNIRTWDTIYGIALLIIGIAILTALHFAGNKKKLMANDLKAPPTETKKFATTLSDGQQDIQKAENKKF